MNQKAITRKLTAILYADVAGYSRLTRLDEEATHHQVMEVLDFASQTINNGEGKVLRYAGDSILAEFQSIVAATETAVKIQQTLSQRNAMKPENEKIQVRIGLNLGEVMEDRGEIFGDGVNLAARLQAAAPPGGICVSSFAYEQIIGKLDIQFSDDGKQTFKNIDKPIHIYHWHPQGVTISAGSLDLPGKPSIAVLPFTNMSGDPEQEYFSDGIAEDIITALSKVSNLIVVARSSTFTYKGTSVDIKQVGREQGVHYVLQGSVRKASNRVRVTAQLIDATSGHHIWAERYDRELSDIFAVQDELMREIVVALDVELQEGEQVRMWSSGTKNVEAWECVRLSAPIILGSDTGRLTKAREWLERALELDPEYAIAWVMLGWFHQNYVDVAGGISDPLEMHKSLENMRECAQKAIELDPSCADAYSVMAMCHMELNEFDQAIENAEMSIELAPGNAENLCEAAVILNKSGESKRALELAKRALRLCPMYRAGFLRALAASYRFTGNPEAAAGTLKEAVKRQPDMLSGYVNLASVLGELGRVDEAKDTVTQILRLAPEFSIKAYSRGLSYRNAEDLLRVEHGLRHVGLPE